jgi:GMP reductase
MYIESDIKLGFKNVLIRPKRSKLSSRSLVDVTREFHFVNSGVDWKGVPIIAANMDTVGTFAIAKALSKEQAMTALHKHYSEQEWDTFISECDNDMYERFMVSTGTSSNDFTKLEVILDKYKEIKFICIDVANGYTQSFVEFVKRVRGSYQDKTIIAGNVVTGEMVEELIMAGADLIKVGIGPGSVCTTRLKTGIGYPQLSAVIECADAAHGLSGHIISDGGCTCAGDIVKAFGGGADFVMLGGMLAGHDESDGELIERAGKQYKVFYGMSSTTAMDKHAGGVAQYRASEGKVVEVPYRGQIADTMSDILGGIRSACTYVGAKQLRELSKRTTFIRVEEQENGIFSDF